MIMRVKISAVLINIFVPDVALIRRRCFIEGSPYLSKYGKMIKRGTYEMTQGGEYEMIKGVISKTVLNTLT